MKLIFFITIIFSILFGCHPKNTNISQGEKQYIFYPSLPNEPKYQFLATINTIKKPPKSWFFKFVTGEEGDEADDKVVRPYGIDFYDGAMYVCDVGQGFVAVIDLKNNEFRKIGAAGPGKLGKPVNLRIDPVRKELYVADNGKKQIIVYDLKGNPKRVYGKKEQFNPVSLEFYGNKLFVCDIKHHTVQVLDRTSGELLYQIGHTGSKPGQLFHPTNIWIRNRKLYVSDTSNFRVQIFDLNGEFMSTFGQIGDTPGSFARNKGIAVDKDDNVFVVDAAFENVQVFNSENQLLLFFPGKEDLIGGVSLPAGISISYEDHSVFKEYVSPNFKPEYLIFVTSNFGSNKINVYAYGEYKK